MSAVSDIQDLRNTAFSLPWLYAQIKQHGLLATSAMLKQHAESTPATGAGTEIPARRSRFSLGKLASRSNKDASADVQVLRTALQSLQHAGHTVVSERDLSFSLLLELTNRPVSDRLQALLHDARHGLLVKPVVPVHTKHPALLDAWHHGERVLAVVVLEVPDQASMVVSACVRRILKVWDPETGALLREINDAAPELADARLPVSSSITAPIAALRHGCVASSFASANVSVWNASTGRRFTTITGHEATITCVRSYVGIAADGLARNRLLTGDALGMIRVWEVSSDETMPYEAVTVLAGHRHAVFDISASPDGVMAVSTTQDRTAFVWSMDTGTCLRALKEHSGTRVCFVTNTSVLIGSMALWNASTGRLERRAVKNEQSTATTSAVAFADGPYSFSCDSSGAVRSMAWSVGECRGVMRVHHPATGLAVLAPQRIVSAHADGTLRVWDITRATDPRHDHEPSSVLCVAAASRGRLVVAGCRDGTLRLRTQDAAGLSDASDSATQVLRGHTGAVDALAISHNDKLIASGSRDTSVRLWSGSGSHRCLHVLTGHDAGVSAVVFAARGTHLVTASGDRTTRVWSASDGSLLHQLSGHLDQVRCLARLGTNLVLGGGWASQAVCHDVRTGKQVLCVKTSGTLSHIEASRDGGCIVTACLNQSHAIVWRRNLAASAAETGLVEQARLQAPDNQLIHSLGVLADGTRAVTLHRDPCLLRVWCTRTGAELDCVTLPDATSCISVCDSSKKTYLVCGTLTGDLGRFLIC